MNYTQQEVAERAQRILSQPFGLRLGTINEFSDMAEGGSADGIRSEYYPKKPDAFFRDVLKLVNKGSI
jgi:hypothetical protein